VRTRPTPSLLLLLAALSGCNLPRKPSAASQAPAPAPVPRTLAPVPAPLPVIILEPDRTHALPDRGYDALRYDLDLAVEPEHHLLRGVMRMTFRVSRPLSRVELDAVEMEIEGTRLEVLDPADPSASRPAGGERHHDDGRILEVFADPPLAAGSVARVEVHYRTTPSAGLYFELPADRGVPGEPHVYTQGECDDARRWFPCNDEPSDRARQSLTATVPLAWSTVAAGHRELRTVDRDKGTATESWSLSRDMPTYLFTFAAGPFVHLEDAWDGIPIEYVVEKSDAKAARASLAATPDVLRFYSEYTGFRYPFSKYATVAVRDFPYGGMENVSATTITRQALHPERYLEEFPAWGLVAHEAAHQWFGDVVTCRSWPHAWLNEGFATYFNLLYQRETEGEAAFLYAMGRTIDSYLDACRGPNLRAVVKEEYRYPMDLFFDGTIYPGGAARLQLLRGWLGEKVFREGIRLHLQEHAWQSVTTADFRRSMEEASGRNLESFFRTWFYRKGYPEVEVSWRVDPRHQLVVDVRQTQDVSNDVPAAFPFPLDLRWLAGGKVHTARFAVSKREQTFTAPAGSGEVPFLEVDPAAILPARLRQIEPLDATLARLRGSESSRVRTLAIRDLTAARTSEGVREALWKAAESDPLALVRTEAAGALRPDLAIAELPRAIEAWRKEPSVAGKNAWLPSLARFAGTSQVDGILSGLLADPGASPGARVIALRAQAARASDQALWGLLEPWTKVDSEGDLVRGAALEVLARRLPDLRTRALLLRLAAKGNPMTTRQTAVRLLEGFLAMDAPDGPAVRGVRTALASPFDPLRRTACEVAGRNAGIFAADIRRLLRHEPDPRSRRVLEAGLNGQP